VNWTEAQKPEAPRSLPWMSARLYYMNSSTPKVQALKSPTRLTSDASKGKVNCINSDCHCPPEGFLVSKVFWSFMLKLLPQVPQGRQESVPQTPHTLKMMMQSQVEHKPQNSFLHTCGSQCFRWTSTMSTLLRTLLSYQKTHTLWHRHHHTCSVKAGFNNCNKHLSYQKEPAFLSTKKSHKWTFLNLKQWGPQSWTLWSRRCHIYIDKRLP